MYDEVLRNEVHCCLQLILGKKKDETVDGWKNG